MGEYIHYDIQMAHRLQELGVKNYGALLLYSKILTMSKGNQYCIVSNKYLANILSTSPRNIQRYLTILKNAKVITIFDEREKSKDINYSFRKIYPKVTDKEVNNFGMTKCSYGGDEIGQNPMTKCTALHDEIGQNPMTKSSPSNRYSNRYSNSGRCAPLLTQENLSSLEFNSTTLSNFDMLEIIERKYLNYYSSSDYNNLSNDQLLDVMINDFTSKPFDCNKNTVYSYGKYLFDKYDREK